MVRSEGCGWLCIWWTWSIKEHSSTKAPAIQRDQWLKSSSVNYHVNLGQSFQRKRKQALVLIPSISDHHNQSAQKLQAREGSLFLGDDDETIEQLPFIHSTFINSYDVWGTLLSPRILWFIRDCICPRWYVQWHTETRVWVLEKVSSKGSKLKM